MALQKQPISISFNQGLETKTDKFQIPIGKFLTLNNSVFTTQGRLTKRNGFKNLTALPNAEQTTLTTLNDNLIATGSFLYAYNSDSDEWLNRGIIQPVQLNVQPLVRVSTSQSSPDMAVASNGIACLVYVDNGVSYYQMSDSTTGQHLVNRTAILSTATDPRVFILGGYFIITYKATISAATHLQALPIPIATPSAPLTAINISSTVNNLAAGYDAVESNNSLYIGWANAGNSIKLAYLSSTLLVSTAVTIAGHTATLMSLTADISASTAVIWISFWDSSSTNGYVAAYNQILGVILAPTQIITTTVINEVTSIATNAVLTVFYENQNQYNSVGADPSTAKTDFISKIAVTQAGSVGSASVILRSVGLASKTWIDATSGIVYMLATYGESNQPTYFLIDSSGNIYLRLAYANGGGYAASQVLPSISYANGQYMYPYLIKDFLTTVNKDTFATGLTANQVNAIYTQTGVNIAQFSINTNSQYSSEIAGALHLTGGILWEYDAVKPVEHGFQVWPENVAGTTTTGAGAITAGTYYYQFTYEWTDNAGNLHRSAPSIPYLVTTTTSSSTNTLYVPTLRLTYKIAPNPVRIVGYRWSAAQQVYYQFTSVSSPTLNNPSIDYVTITDTLADLSILGNAIIYTAGGVIEDIAAPACIASALFNNRLWLIDAEDRNLLWFSKQVIEAVPVEMSDLLTLYVAPTSGAQGSTGPMTALSAMDDKLIIFKRDAIYYINGSGPDNTDANSQFSDPIFITSAVGCSNPNSIVLMPQGLMFQSDKGIWLLGRDLSTQYIGSPVEAYNNNVIMSAKSIPTTNQVRFVLDNNMTLMYDYFYNQWGTFSNVYAISSTLYQNTDTYLNTYGSIYQESPNTYVDGSVPVLMSFTTGWMNIAGLQGYERFYFANLLGTYITPFKLNMGLAYDYNSSAIQNILITPDNYAAPWGGEAVWGSGPAWGGPGNVFTARAFPEKQKCQSFQVSINEIYDPTFNVSPGQGLTLSGLALIVGVKRGFRTQSAAKSFG